MSAVRDQAPMLLAESAIQIALNYLERSGEIDDYTEACEFLIDRIGFMIRHSQYNKLLLANRAITAFQRYRVARTINLSLASG